MYNLHGKVALVTGAGGKKWYRTSHRDTIGERGCRWSLSTILPSILMQQMRQNGTDYPMSSAKLRRMGRRAISVVADVSDAKQVAEMVDKTVAHFGKIDILVNNAGTKAGKDRVPVVDLTEADWDRVQRVNVKGVFLCSQAVARHLIAQGTGGKNYQYVFCYRETRISTLCRIQCLKIRCDRVHAITGTRTCTLWCECQRHLSWTCGHRTRRTSGICAHARIFPQMNNARRTHANPRQLSPSDGSPRAQMLPRWLLSSPQTKPLTSPGFPSPFQAAP